MQKRSKFLTFVLSCIPGVGHFYLGLMVRGFTFIAAFFGWITFVAALSMVFSYSGFQVLLLALPIIWFYSFFDALHQREKMAAGEEVKDVSPLTELMQGEESGKKSKVWAVIFSFIPGAGHMYLGFQEQGLQLMTGFFLSLFIMDWLRMSFMVFVIPIIWFYSMFDALQKVSQPQVSQKKDFFFVDWLRRNQRFVAYVLIGMGVLLILNRFCFEYMALQYNKYVQTAVVSLLLIGGGIKLLWGTKVEKRAVTGSRMDSSANGTTSFSEETASEKTADKEEEASSGETGAEDGSIEDFEVKTAANGVEQDNAQRPAEKPESDEEDEENAGE